MIFTTVYITKDCAKILLEGVPSRFDIEKFEKKLRAIDGINKIDKLHIWAINNEKVMMTAHISSYDPNATLARINKFAKS